MCVEDSKFLFISISYGDKEETTFANELDAIYFLKNKLVQRLEEIEEWNLYVFPLRTKIRVNYRYDRYGSGNVVDNEIDAIEDLKSLYFERLDIEFKSTL